MRPLSGRHTGTFVGIPATGRGVSITSFNVFRLADGKIVKSWVVADALGLLQQLGVVPRLDGAPATPRP